MGFSSLDSPHKTPTMTTKKPTCVVCDESLNKTVHSSVRCPYCAFTACRSCCEKYVLDKTVATCMNNACNKEWTRKFLVEVFTQKFVTSPWKLNREKVLFEREKALMPATQGVVETIIAKEKIQAEIVEVDKLLLSIQARRRDLVLSLQGNFVPKERRHFIRACADAECRGFLSSAFAKCGLCEKKTCSECHVVKTDDHACNGSAAMARHHEQSETFSADAK